MEINYALENLGKAVLICIATSLGRGHFPPDLRERFDTMIKAFTMTPYDTGGVRVPLSHQCLAGLALATDAGGFHQQN
jgi:hypothetical protein